MSKEGKAKRSKPSKLAPPPPSPPLPSDDLTPEPAEPSTAPAKKRKRAEDTTYDTAEEEEVLSHKEKRKQKKLAKLQAASGVATTDETKPATAKATAAPTRLPRSEYGVWIGNMAFATTPDKLTAFLVEGGCTAPTRVNMPKGKQPHEKNKGFAYVDFAEEEAAKAAVALSEGHLDGRKLLIKLNNDFQGRPSGVTASTLGGLTLSKTARRIADRQKNPPAPTLFMGNLGFETDDSHIRSMFEGHHLAALKWAPKGKGKQESPDIADEEEAPKPETPAVELTDEAKARASVHIRKVRLGTFEDTGKCKGWAFVDFKTAQDATIALLNPRNHHLHGRNLTLEYATADAVRRGGGLMPGAPPRSAETPAARPPRPQPQRYLGPAVEEGGEAPVEVEEEEAKPVRKRKYEERKGGKRPKPGAVLAKVQRATAGIVASEGKKVVFE